MMGLIRAVVRAAAILTIFACTPATAGTSVLFILDGSGSMWERVDGQPKIVTAKKVMNDALGKISSEAQLGLMTYGIHRKGDCGDITLLSPIGSQSASAIAKQVSAIMPKGDTPIAGALLKAGDAFKNVSGKKMIVLITDGAEECHGDPCAAVKQLQAGGLDVQINVVGFNLGAKQRGAVKCIADEGHGQYFDAQNTAGLTDAMKEVQTEVAEAPPPPPPPAPPNLLAASQGGQLLAAPNANWAGIVTGKDSDVVPFPGCGGFPADAIFAFKNNQPATFSEFEILIPGTGEWVKDFELLAADDAPTGNYRSLGKFTAANLRMLQTPYQEFSFPETTAKYFIFRVLSGDPGDCNNKLTQIRLIGSAAAGNANAVTNTGPDNNLLSAAEGGVMISAPNADWPRAVSEKEGDYARFSACGGLPAEAVFGFKGGHAASFSKFEMLIPSTGEWVKDFELLVSDAPDHNFHSLGKFTAANLRMVQSPYQAFNFAPATAKYFMFRILSGDPGDCNNALSQTRLAGTLAAGPDAPKPQPPPGVNLLAPQQGGKLAGGQNWAVAVDGKDADYASFSACGGTPAEAVFGFKNGKPANFSVFEILIPNTGEWVKDFELFAGNDGPTGQFRSLGKFTIHNVRMIQDPYQQFHFAATGAKFFKFRILSGEPGDCNNALTQIRLIGTPSP